MAEQKEVSSEEIVHYYDDTISQYKRIWKLNENMAMHYGFWMDGVRNFGAALAKQNEVTANRANIQSGDVVLDAGCGVGGSSVYLAQRGCEVRGITLSEKQIGVARQNARRHGVDDRAFFEVRDYTKTGYEAASFDVVWAMESVCHAADKKDFIAEAYRVLKSGGRLIVSDGFATKSSYSTDEQQLMDKWLHNWAIKDLAYIDGFLSDLKEAGFVDVECDDMTPYVMRSSRMMRFWARLGLWHSNTLRALGIHRDYDTDAKRGNMIGSIAQYPVFRDGLSKHCIVFARKG